MILSRNLGSTRGKNWALSGYLDAVLGVGDGAPADVERVRSVGCDSGRGEDDGHLKRARVCFLLAPIGCLDSAIFRVKPYLVIVGRVARPYLGSEAALRTSRDGDVVAGLGLQVLEQVPAEKIGLRLRQTVPNLFKVRNDVQMHDDRRATRIVIFEVRCDTHVSSGWLTRYWRF